MGNWKIVQQLNDQSVETDHHDEQTIPVVEERIQIETKMIETGKVNISKKVLTETYSADIPVLKEEVIVERRRSINTLMVKRQGFDLTETPLLFL